MASQYTYGLYRLLPHCRLVTGFKRAAIYDLKSGGVYSVNELAKEILLNHKQNISYWEKLIKLKLATKNSKRDVPFQLSPIAAKLKFAWLEITEKCNLRCIHCYGRFGKPVATHIEINWFSLLDQIKKIGCNSIQFIGGEPLTHPKLKELIIYADNLGFKRIEVFTNGTLITPEWIIFFKKYQVHLAFSYYSSEPKIHDQITQMKGSHIKTSIAINLAKKSKIPFRLAIVVMKQNQSTLDTTVKALCMNGIKCRRPDVVRPSGRGDDKTLQPDDSVLKTYALQTSPPAYVKSEDFQLRLTYNSCWFGKIAITYNGDVIPCIFARKNIAGNVKNHALKKILDSMQTSYWKTTLDFVDVCRDCEFRYSCHNCRPLSESTYGKLTSHNPRCAYNPYAGVWHKTYNKNIDKIQNRR